MQDPWNQKTLEFSERRKCWGKVAIPCSYVALLQWGSGHDNYSLPQNWCQRHDLLGVFCAIFCCAAFPCMVIQLSGLELRCCFFLISGQRHEEWALSPQQQRWVEAWFHRRHYTVVTSLCWQWLLRWDDLVWSQAVRKRDRKCVKDLCDCRCGRTAAAKRCQQHGAHAQLIPCIRH